MAGAESSDFSAIIMLCDSVACPEGKLYIQGGGCGLCSPTATPSGFRGLAWPSS